MRVAAAALADDLDVFRLGSLLALRDVELDLLPFLQAPVAATRDRAEVHEHIGAVCDLDEAVTLVAVEPLHRALRHLDLLLVLDAAPAAGTGPDAFHDCRGQPLTQHAEGVSLRSPTRAWATGRPCPARSQPGSYATAATQATSPRWGQPG